MKIFIAGATGAIGRPLVTGLVAAGHEVIGMTRTAQKAHVLSELGAKPVVVDAFDAVAVRTAMIQAQPEVVIEQLTSLPQTYTRASMTAAAELDARLRKEGGANVQAAAQAAGVRRYIIQSSAFWYAPGEGLATEETPFAFDATPAIALWAAPFGSIASGTRVYADTEHRVLSATNLEGIALRYGFFYGPGTWFSKDGDVANQVRQQQYPIVGEGKGVWSWVHIEDVAQATIAAVHQGTSGIYNINDDQPVELRVWLSALARTLGAQPPVRVTEEEAELAQGSDAVYYANHLRGASNAKAKRELNWQPRPLEWLAEVSAL
ncbi:MULTISPECIES: NAD-dependent epimerase/dehydratase family protein [Nostocales]|uniref:NAD-dependent epimerase/dehydratase family protein n=1 Tax=Tolypothrix campylonemoides VB511288_2 TaxID=3232311 RepID=A0ABW8X2A8_9CYAN